MKAEHRKELQTNALADRMGRVIQKMKQRPSRGSFLTVVLVIFVVLAGIFFLWRRSRAAEQAAAAWVDFSRTQEKQTLELVMDKLEPVQPRVARLADIQLAWIDLYENGIKMMAVDPRRAAANIKLAKGRYERLLPDLKDDPVLAPEAHYALAVAEESLAVDDPVTHLSAARELYNAVAKDYPKSAHAKLAEKRAKQLSNSEERARIERFYNALGRSVAVPPQFGQQPNIEELLRQWKQQQQK
jgi:hypothetical protein